MMRATDRDNRWVTVLLGTLLCACAQGGIDAARHDASGTESAGAGGRSGSASSGRSDPDRAGSDGNGGSSREAIGGAGGTTVTGTGGGVSSAAGASTGSGGAFVSTGGAGGRDAGASGGDSGTARSYDLVYQHAPADNPLKGFMPYAGSYAFPHSLEWFYVPLSAVVSGPSSFTFDSGLEPHLSAISARGHQAVFRVYLDYPAKPTGVPQFLIEQGLTLQSYGDYGGGKAPDYEFEPLVSALEAFIAALGSRYDGDPRIGFLQVGLLGFWGEWHTYPHESWFASTRTQNRVLRAFSAAFQRTKLLVRRPAADSPSLAMGYHDDSFAYETLGPTDWHFWPLVERAGIANIWQTQPIGGELRPEIQSSLFDNPPSSPEDYAACVKTTHASWLLAQAPFSDGSFSGAKRERAIAAAQALGYELFVSQIRVAPNSGSNEIAVTISNRGVAPFYYDWPLEVRWLTSEREHTWHPSWRLSSIQPGQEQTFTTSTPSAVPLAGATLQIRVPNPMPGGRPLRFANGEQTSTNGEWLSVELK